MILYVYFSLDDLSKMEYQKVIVRGHFDHSKELYIGPRALLTPDDESGSLMSSQPKSGHLVITPFHLADRKQVYVFLIYLLSIILKI